MNFIISAETDIGTTKQTNQDSFCARVFETGQGPMALMVLCDGMGGLSRGEVASSSLVAAFKEWSETRLRELCRTGINDADIREDWTNIALQYNEKIKLYGASCGVSMGTTLTAMLLTSQRYYIVNVGDTRAYEITDQARVLTHDQTVVARDVELGLITEEQAKTDARRSVLLQCVGASDAVYPDMFFGDTRQDAVYILCSDGFRHEITGEEIWQYLNAECMTSAEGMQANLRALIDMNMQRQERDNITAVAVRTF